MRMTLGLVLLSAVALHAQDAVKVAEALPGRTDEKIVRRATLENGTEIVVDPSATAGIYATKGKGECRKIAIFTRNEAGEAFADAARRIQNQLTAQVSGEVFEILDPQDVILALAPLAESLQKADGVGQLAGEEVVMRWVAQRLGREAEGTADGRGASQDQKLLANTSALRLSQNMDADYLLMLTLDKFDKSRKTYKSKDLDAPVVTEVYKLSASYKILDGYSGASIGGNTLSVAKSYRQTSGIEIEPGQYADGLEEAVVEKLKADMLASASKWRQASKAASGILVEFKALAYTMDDMPVYYPKYDGATRVVAENVPLQIQAAVEVDGITVGMTPGKFALAPGLHKVRLTRQGFDDVAMTIKPVENAAFTFTLRMTEGEANRIQKTIAFTHALTVNRELSQAEVKRLEGEAKMLEQSGYRIDSKTAPNVQLMMPLFTK